MRKRADLKMENNDKFEDFRKMMLEGLAKEFGIPEEEIRGKGHSAEDCAVCDKKDTCPGAGLKGVLKDLLNKSDNDKYEAISELKVPEELALYIRTVKTRTAVQGLRAQLKDFTELYNEAAAEANAASKALWDKIRDRLGIDPDDETTFRIDNNTFVIEKKVDDKQ